VTQKGAADPLDEGLHIRALRRANDYLDAETLPELVGGGFNRCSHRVICSWRAGQQSGTGEYSTFANRLRRNRADLREREEYLHSLLMG
jgi:hypothetical protein